MHRACAAKHVQRLLGAIGKGSAQGLAAETHMAGLLLIGYLLSLPSRPGTSTPAIQALASLRP
jgi:hypothetical protein